MTSRAADVLNTCRQRGLTLATAESLTGGLVCATLVDVPGASDVVRGGVVAYATDLKHVLLGVDSDLLAARGAVDPDVALAMASGVAARSSADLGVSTTGVAGPDSQDGVAPGTVYIALGGIVTRVERFDFHGDRAAVRAQAVDAALELVLSALG